LKRLHRGAKTASDSVDGQNPALLVIYGIGKRLVSMMHLTSFPKIQLLPRISKSNFASFKKKITFIVEMNIHKTIFKLTKCQAKRISTG